MTYSDDLQPASTHPQHMLPPRHECDTCRWLNAFADDSIVRQSHLARDTNGNLEDGEVLRNMVKEEDALRNAFTAHAVLPHRPMEARHTLRRV